MYFNTVSRQLKLLIENISNQAVFSQFRLCGGTALSLQIGHRISIDADFVSEIGFDKDELVQNLIRLFPNATDIYQSSIGVFLKIDGIKVDFLSWGIPFIRGPFINEGINLLHIEEIIAMKLFAITQRGEKKDYMDIATLLNKYSLLQMIEFYQERHRGSDAAVALRFLASYSDINNQPEPNMLNGLSWEDSKALLNEAIKQTVVN